MQLVNKKYVKMTKFEVFSQMVNAGATTEKYDEVKVEYFQNLLRVIMDYENSGRHKTYINEFYINVDDIDIFQTTISRETIVNALVYASVNYEFDMVKRIIPYLYKSEYLYTCNDEILDYILEHGVDTNEYIDGIEHNKLIFNSSTNSLELGLIFDNKTKLIKKNQ